MEVTAEQIEVLFAEIEFLGPDAEAALYKFETFEQAQEAAYSVVDNEPAIVSIVRAGKGKIGTIRHQDYTLLFLGGLFSSVQMDAAHLRITDAGGESQVAALSEELT